MKRPDVPDLGYMLFDRLDSARLMEALWRLGMLCADDPESEQSVAATIARAFVFEIDRGGGTAPLWLKELAEVDR